MDNENKKLAYESITSIVKSAIEKGNMTLEDIAELTQNLKNVFIPAEHIKPINQGARIDSQYPVNLDYDSHQKIAESTEQLTPEHPERPRITFQQYKDGLNKELFFCKLGAEILDPENTYNEEYIICLEDLEPKQMLTSYLKRKFNLTPEEYRKKWGLPKDYPMLTKSLSETRRRNGVKRKRN